MTTVTRVPLALALVVAAVSGTLPAQQALYSRSAGDTLRYHNMTKMDGVMHGAAGDTPFTLSRTATFAFVFSGGDTLTAWYDALAIDASGALAGETPNSEALLHAPFRLRMEPNGRVTTIKSPGLPRAARLFAELPTQLDDFFTRLPASGKMPIGAKWADTATRTESDSAGHRLSIRRISHYRALRDSTIGRRRVVVISQHTDIRITSSVPMQQQPYVDALSLSGIEDGTALFCVAEGRLLSRERNGRLRGSVTYRGGDSPWVVNQSYRYHRTDVLEDVAPRL